VEDGGVRGRDRDGSGAAFAALARAALIAALASVAALFAAAKCYPPNTRVVVFVQGVYTSYDASGTASDGVEPHTFDTLKQQFLGSAYDRAKLLDFSYAGGTMSSTGLWQPAPYSCEITDRTSDENLAPLEQMLRDYRARHPKVHFTLVGHSLGGYLVFLEGAREAARPDADKLDIDVVVTLDAPLLGVGADKMVALDFSSQCAKTYLAGGELVEARQDPTTPATRVAQARAMAAAGIRLGTLGNSLDCLYNLPSCVGFGTNDVDTQFLPHDAAVSRQYAIPATPFLSHFAILADATAMSDAATFVGAP
jgi:hypothetical protein